MTPYLNRFILLLAVVFLGSSVMAQGPADKVTGGFWHAASPESRIFGKRISAHEASSRQPQHGFIYIVFPDGHAWSSIDLSDTQNACVNVYADGKARIGGRITDGIPDYLGRWYGWELEDVGEPAAGRDLSTTYRFGDADDLLQWCETGYYDNAISGGFPHTVLSGNLKIHNFAGDAD